MATRAGSFKAEHPFGTPPRSKRDTLAVQLPFLVRCGSLILASNPTFLPSLTEKRVEGSAKIRAKYPDRVACIVEAARKDDPVLEQRKFLVPSDSTVAKFIFQIRKQMKLDDHENVFVFVGENQQQPIGTALMIDVYQHNKCVSRTISFSISKILTLGISFPTTETRTASSMSHIALRASSANRCVLLPFTPFVVNICTYLYHSLIHARILSHFYLHPQAFGSNDKFFESSIFAFPASSIAHSVVS